MQILKRHHHNGSLYVVFTPKSLRDMRLYNKSVGCARVYVQIYAGAHLPDIQRTVDYWSLHGFRQSDSLLDGNQATHFVLLVDI